MLDQYSKNANVRILGTDLDSILRLMIPGISHYIPKPLIKALGRRWGWSLWFHGNKGVKICVA